MKLVIYVPKSHGYTVISNNMIFFHNNLSVYSCGVAANSCVTFFVWVNDLLKNYDEALHNALVKANRFNTVARHPIKVEFKQIN